MNDVADYDVIEINVFFLTIARNGTGRLDHCQQLGRCVAATVFLNKAQQARKHDHRNDNDDRGTGEVFWPAAKQGKVRKNHIGKRGHDCQNQ